MDARLLAVVCVQFSDQTLEREFLLQDFRATAIFVPLFAFVVNALVFVLLLAVPAARPGGAFIFPTFLAIGLGRVLVQFMADEEHALQVYGWMWVASTVTMFSGWVDAQRRYELVTGLGVGFHRDSLHDGTRGRRHGAAQYYPDTGTSTRSASRG